MLSFVNRVGSLATDSWRMRRYARAREQIGILDIKPSSLE